MNKIKSVIVVLMLGLSVTPAMGYHYQKNILPLYVASDEQFKSVFDDISENKLLPLLEEKCEELMSMPQAEQSIGVAMGIDYYAAICFVAHIMGQNIRPDGDPYLISPMIGWINPEKTYKCVKDYLSIKDGVDSEKLVFIWNIFRFARFRYCLPGSSKGYSLEDLKKHPNYDKLKFENEDQLYKALNDLYYGEFGRLLE